MSLGVFALIAACVAIAGFVQGSTGVGFALIVAPVLALFAPDLVPASLLALMIPLNVAVAWGERHALDRAGAGWITAGRFAGTFGGLWLLSALSAGDLGVLIGAATIAAALATIVAPSFTPGHRALLAAGIVTGITETATGIGGPPLALVYQHQAAARLRATIAFCFLVGELMSLAVLALASRVGAAQLGWALALVPALAAGVGASRLMRDRVRDGSLRVVVLLFAIGSGIVLVARG